MKFSLLFCSFCSCISYTISFRKHDLRPISSRPFFSRNYDMRYSKSDECHCSWENVTDTKHIVMDKFFGQQIERDQKCEVFCIEGVPAASMIYSKSNSRNNPNVDAFYINKGLLFLFEAGSHMRSKLFRRYKHIDIRNATNRNEFLLF